MSNKLLALLLSLQVICVLGLGALLLKGDAPLPSPQKPLGGTTNYDSLELQPAQASDFALRIRNSTGTVVYGMDGAGNVVVTSSARFGTLVVKDSDGSVTTLTDSATTSTQTLSVSHQCGETIPNVNFTTATGTLTFATTSGMIAPSGCLPSVGDKIEFMVRNGSSSGAFFFNAPASSSIAVTVSSSTAPGFFGTSTVSYGGIARVTAVHITSSTDWIVYLVNIFK